MKRTGFRKKSIEESKPLKRGNGLKKRGTSKVSKTKDRIQALLRQNAIRRDGECVLRRYEYLLPTQYFDCGPRRTDGEIIVQAEHLVGRKNSVSYADMDNIILLCQRHHFYFKQQHGALYWHMVRLIVGEERWDKIQEWERQEKAHKATRVSASDWERMEGELSSAV